MATINLFVGQEDGDSSVEDYLYVNLRAADREVPLYKSKQSLECLSPKDLLEEFEKAMNEARLWAKELFVDILLDEDELLVLLEDCDENTLKHFEKLFKQIRKEG